MSLEQEKYSRWERKPSAKHGVGERNLDLFPLQETASSDVILAGIFHGFACQVGGVFQTSFLSTSTRNKSFSLKNIKHYISGALNWKKTSNRKHINVWIFDFHRKERRYKFSNLGSTLAVTLRKTTNNGTRWRTEQVRQGRSDHIRTYARAYLQERQKELNRLVW